MSNRWSAETTVKFVRLYRKHENLWNVFIPEYRHRDYRSASFEAIACELNLTNFSKEDVPKKIKILRSTYYLELAKIEKNKASGGDTDFVYESLLPWFDDMNHIIKTQNSVIKTETVKENETYSNFVSKPIIYLLLFTHLLKKKND